MTVYSTQALNPMQYLQYLYDLQQDALELFKAQDADAGDFDVTFLIDGKKLYAHKHRLTTVSPTFRSMLSERWTSKDAPIEIKDYSFESFKEFLLFIYSGSCSLTTDNIFTMVDIAEYYGVKVFKIACDDFLSRMKFTFQNFLQFIELSDKYSLEKAKASLNIYIAGNFISFLKFGKFQALEKDAIGTVLKFNQNTLRPEELFEQVFKWAETRATEKQNADPTLIVNDLIKNDLADILPFINFTDMHIKFLLNFVVKKSFLFSGDGLSNILLGAWGKVYVKIFDEHERIMKGILDCPDMEKVCTVIESQKNILCTSHYGYGFYWPTKQKKPKTPSIVIKNEIVKWYLVYNENGHLCIKNQTSLDDSCYLLAEMTAEIGFTFINKCKIEVYRFA